MMNISKEEKKWMIWVVYEKRKVIDTVKMEMVKKNKEKKKQKTN